MNEVIVALETLQKQLTAEERVKMLLRANEDGENASVTQEETENAAPKNTCIPKSEVISRLGILLERVKRIQSTGEGIINMHSRALESLMFCSGSGLSILASATKRCYLGGSASQTKERRVEMLMKMIPEILQLLRTDKVATKRDIFYNNKQLFGQQRVLDSLIEDIARIIEVPRICLNVIATSKGLVAGDLSFVDATGNLVDCVNSTEGILISSEVDTFTQMRTGNAKLILVVEKDAIFQKLLGDSYTNTIGDAIIITGKGYPDQATRRLVRRLWEELKIPVFCLVDADPHGMEIFFTYKFGSMSMASECSRLATPVMKCIGLHPSDFERLLIPREGLLPMTTQDLRKIAALESRPYVKNDARWKAQLEIMKRLGVKAEIEALVKVSPRFLTEVYLPSKIRANGWV